MPSFLFDRDFDQEQEDALQRPATAPAPGLSTAQVEALCDKARAEGHAAGYAEGFAEAEAAAKAQVEAHIAASLTSLGPALDDLSATAATARSQRLQELARLLHSMADRLLPEILTEFSPRRTEAFARHALRMIEGTSEAEILVPEALLSQVQSALAPHLGARAITLRGDPTLALGEARAHWANGHAELALPPLHDALLASLAALSASTSERI